MLLNYLLTALLMMRQKPVRTALSMLGIYIGVAALGVILAMHEGMRRGIEDVYSTAGASVFMLQPIFDSNTQQAGQLTPSDVNMLKTLPGIQSVMPRLNLSRKIRGQNDVQEVGLVAADDAFFNVYRIPLKAGRFFMREEVRTNQPVAVLTESTARKLFPLGSPLGRLINVEGKTYEVVGIAGWNADINTRARLDAEPGGLLPPGCLLREEPETNLQLIELRASADADEAQVAKRIMSAITRDEPSRQELFTVQSLREVQKTEAEFSQAALSSLLAIAAISLIVGGIGVANVMLTSVTERTREIGVRKALGAKRNDILLQFLVESCILSATGGLMAILSVWVGCKAAQSLDITKTPLEMPPLPTFGCLAVTATIGLLAGLYPASRAAMRSPADALRYE